MPYLGAKWQQQRQPPPLVVGRRLNAQRDLHVHAASASVDVRGDESGGAESRARRIFRRDDKHMIATVAVPMRQFGGLGVRRVAREHRDQNASARRVSDRVARANECRMQTRGVRRRPPRVACRKRVDEDAKASRERAAAKFALPIENQVAVAHR